MEKEFYYSESYECEINTADVYHAVSGECSKQFSETILQDFIQTLELTLIQKKVEPTAPFYPNNWLYFKEKYLTWRDSDYRTDIFRPDFFIHSCENYSFDLTDAQWLSMVYKKRKNVEQEYDRFISLFGAKSFAELPKEKQEKLKQDEEDKILKDKESGIEYIEDISEKKKQEVVAKLKSGKHSKILDDDDPFQWIRWSYDVYAHYQECVLSYKEDRKPFEYFFAFRLELIDPYDVKLFLNWHLENTFEGDADNLKEFIEILYMKFPKILVNPNIKSLTFKFSDSVKSIVTDNEENIKRLGRKPAKKIEIPITIEKRKPNDTLTILTSEQSAILFKYLKKSNFLLSSNELLNTTNFAKAIRALTGYGEENMKDNIEKLEHNNFDKRTVLNFLINIKGLIESELAYKKHPSK